MTSRAAETLEQEGMGAPESVGRLPPQPGLVLIFSAGRPLMQVFPLLAGAREIGRDALPELQDPLLSRRHAEVTFDAAGFCVRDLGSRNGTAVDGVVLRGPHRSVGARVIRSGGTLFLLCADIRPFQRGVQVGEDGVMGPALLQAWDMIARAGRFGRSLHFHGESGVGKELAARVFHRLSPCAAGPFIAVNCAAIPHGLAERLLFGARKGVYSGAAADAEGYLQAAHRGTLFLDEVAELDLQVQSKLLRVLETQEVLPLGATRATPVELRICSATHKDLRAHVAAGHFREDLYFRIGRPQIDLPPLRERLEEMPWLIEREVRRIDLGLLPHVSLVEACLLGHWPGNVRELIGEARTAALAALAAGSKEVLDQHLPSQAGKVFVASAPSLGSPVDAERQAIERVLHEAGGNVSQAARTLGMHRTQLRRLLARHGIRRSTSARRAAHQQ